MDTELAARFEGIERRLTALEARLGARDADSASSPAQLGELELVVETDGKPAAALAAPERATPEPPKPRSPMLPMDPGDVPVPAAGENKDTPAPVAAGSPATPPAVRAAPARVNVQPRPAASAKPAKPAKPPMTREQWEKLIGTRVLPIAGAVAALVGVAFFLKLGYDMGWLRFAPMWRCVLGFGAGAALVAAGELVRRKLGALASAPVSALGLASMFAAVVAARMLYTLVPASAALVIMVGVAALGVGVAYRARVRTVAVLSFLGAYAAPFLLSVPEPEPVFMPVYLSILLVAGVALAVRFPMLFGFMRTMTTASTALVGTLVAVLQAQHHPLLMSGFLTFVWGVHHVAQAWHCAQRDRIGGVRPRKTAITVGHAIVMTTWWAWLTGAIWNGAVLSSGFAGAAWHVTALGFCATFGGAMVLAGHLRAMVDLPETHAERYGAGLTLEAGGLLFATVALGMSGWTETLAWAGIGVVAALAARWIEARRLLVYGAVALVVATLRLVTVDLPLASTPSPAAIANVSAAMGLVLSRWTLLAIGVGAMWIVAGECARRLSRAHPEQRMLRASVRAFGVMLLAVGAGVVGAAFVHPDASMASMVVAWSLLAAGLAMTRRWIGDLKPERIATVGLLAPVLVWMLTYPVAGWSGSRAPMLLHPGMWTLAVLLAGGSVVLRQLVAGLRADEAPAGTRRVVVWPFFAAALMMTLLATSLEVWRVGPAMGLVESGRIASLAVWWGLCAAVLAICRRMVGWLYPERIATAVLAGAVCAWALAYGNDGWLDSAALMLLHPGLLTLALLLACGAVVLWQFVVGLRAQGMPEAARRVAIWPFFVAGLMLTLVATSFEVWRVAPKAETLGIGKGAGLAVWWGLVGAALATSRRWVSWLYPERFATALLAGGVCAWIVIYGNAEWMDSSAPMLLHPGLWVLAALLASGVVVRHCLDQGVGDPQARRRVMGTFVTAGLLLVLLTSSLEVARVAGMYTDDSTAQAASLSVWWGVFATALIALGMRKRLASLRWAGLVWMGAALCKLVFYDLREITPVWRIVSFIGVGGLMLAVGLWYTSRGKRLFADVQRQNSAPGADGSSA